MVKNPGKKNIVFIIIVIILISTFLCCIKKSTEEELEIMALEEQLAKNPDDIDIITNLINSYSSNEKSDKLVSLYEAHEDKFKDNPLIKCQYGAAMARLAGSSDKIEEKLKWIKKGMIVLDGCVQDYPENSGVYLWRGLTYSHLPAILNARSIVEKDFALVIDNYRNGKWDLTSHELERVYLGYYNVAIEYEDNELFNKAYENLKKDLPDTTLRIHQRYKEY